MTIDAPIGSPSPEVRKTNSFQRMAGAIFAPVSTFAEIARLPDWVIPIVLFTIILVVSSFVVAPHFDMESTLRHQLEAQHQSPEKTERAIELANKVKSFVPYFSLITSPLSFVVVAAVLLIAFKLFAGEGTFPQYLSVVLYGWIPMLLQGIISTAIVSTRGMIGQEEMMSIVRSNPGFLVDPHSAAIPFALLSSIDVFTIWTLALLTIGCAFVARISRGKSAAIVGVLWVVVVVFKVTMAAIRGLGAGA
ncbi:MAG TPA: Yip1 family protein [Thermoanaerobaculia bacterium]|nr:Yip1 family protein [Thermoanaerobaculia bacterium]